MSFQKVRVQPPLHGDSLRKTELTAWVIRVWETHPPEGQEPLEWILLTTIPLVSPADAWEVVQWYRWRWLLEDFHKALKTGCRIEQRYFQDVKALWNVLAVLTPIALRLLLIRQTAQQDTETPATSVVSEDSVRVVIHLDQRHRDIVTAKQLWHAIARMARLPRPYLRWSTRMADLMERVDTCDEHLARRSSRDPFFFFMICV